MVRVCKSHTAHWFLFLQLHIELNNGDKEEGIICDAGSDYAVYVDKFLGSFRPKKTAKKKRRKSKWLNIIFSYGTGRHYWSLVVFGALTHACAQMDNWLSKQNDSTS